MKRAWGITREVGRDAAWVTGMMLASVLTALAGEAALILAFG